MANIFDSEDPYVINQNTGFGGKNPPTAKVHIGSSNGKSNSAPLKLTAGSNLGSPEDGALEYDGTNLYFTVGASRSQLNNNNNIYVRSATLIVAASNSKDTVHADYVCSGVNDDITITNAMNALPTAGGNIILMDGKFNLGNPIAIIKSNISIQGQGGATTLFVQNSVNIQAAITITGTFLHDIKLRRFVIDGNKSNQTSGDGIYILTTVPTADTDNIYEDLIIKNCKNNGIEIGAHNGNGSMYFHRIHITNCDGNGYYDPIFGLTDSVIDTVITDTNKLNGFYIGGVDNHFTNCKAFFNGSSGGNNHGYYLAGYNNYFTLCEAQDNYQSGFYTQGDGISPYFSQFCTFVNCMADSNGISGNSSYCKGIQIVNTKGWQIIGGTWMTRPFPTQSQHYGISLEGTTSKTQIFATSGEANSIAFFNNTASGSGNMLFGQKEDDQFGSRPVIDSANNTFEWDNTPQLFWNTANPNISLFSSSNQVLTVTNTGGGTGGLHVQDDLSNGGNALIGGVGKTISFYGVTEVARQLLATGAGHTVDDVITALQNLGLVRQS